MRTRNFWMAGALLLLAVTVRAQLPFEKQLPPGFERLLDAGSALNANAKLTAAMSKEASLTQMRDALSQRDVVAALAMFRSWLADPHRPENLSTAFEVPFEALGQMRQIARTLGMEQYVQLADGKPRDAISSARDGLRMSYVIKGTGVIGWLTGRAIDQVSLGTLTRHLDQLSIYDCDKLATLADDWMRSSDVIPLLLIKEKRSIQKLLAEQRAATKLAFAKGGTPLIGGDVPVEFQGQNAADFDRAMAEASMRVDSEFEQLLLSLTLPYPERIAAKQLPPTKFTLADRIVQTSFLFIDPIRNLVNDGGRKQQAQAKLLACHAAILHYRWEHLQLPAALTALKMGDVILDPYSGKPFHYEPTATGYLLESVGPFARDEEGNQLSTKRLPIKLATDR